jgi:hypothetical protein
MQYSRLALWSRCAVASAGRACRKLALLRAFSRAFGCCTFFKRLYCRAFPHIPLRADVADQLNWPVMCAVMRIEGDALQALNAVGRVIRMIINHKLSYSFA